jgi:hypothetical protein
MKSKVYVIDPAESSGQADRHWKKGSERVDYSPDEGAATPRSRQRRAARPVDEKGSPALALISYLAGPYSILTTSRGRESRFWVVLAVLSSIAAAVMVARASSIFAAPQGAGAGYVIWLSAACAVALMGFAAWVRGVALLGRHKGWLLKQLPEPVRHPGAVGIFGLIIPGFGLFISGHARRAAAALSAVCAMAISILVLWQAPKLWHLSQAGILKGRGDVLEHVFLISGAVALFGAMVWIVQALDGARLAGLQGEETVRPRGDLAAIALIMAIMGLLAAFKPVDVARTLDRFSISMREDGLRIVPLHASYAAMRLDPSRPEYELQAIMLNEALGRPGEAQELRQDLAERWKPYERMLRLEAAATETAVFGPVAP